MPRGSKPGERRGGRAKGTPNLVTQEIRQIASALVEDPVYVASLTQRLQEGKAPHMETLLFQYAYGKPRDVTEHQGTVRLQVSWLPQ